MLAFCYVIKTLTHREVKMSRTDPQVNVRMPQELIDDLKIQAIKNRRSLTAQLNQIVEEWLKEQKQQESAKA